MRRTLLAIGALLLSGPIASAQIIEYYHLDALGSVRAVTNAAGLVVERHDYFPFGEECTTGPCASNPSVGAGQPTKFTGKERDVETGLDYFGARYYGSKIGRFTTVDPLQTTVENIADPQRWNRYAYVRNNPFRYVDPDGRNLIVLLQLVQRIANSPAGQKVGQFVSTQWANIKMVGARLASSPAAQGAGEAGVQVASGADLPPAPGPGAVVSSPLKAAKHIVLGLEHGLEATAARVGGRTLLKVSDWQQEFLTGVGDPATKFTVSLDGLTGDSAYSKVMRAVQNGIGPNPGYTNWELAQLHQAGRLSDVTFVERGVAVANPFE